MTHDRVQDLANGLDLQTDLWWVAMFFAGLTASMLAAFGFPESSLFWAYLAVSVRLAVALCLAEQPWGSVFSKLLALGAWVGAFSIFGDYLIGEGFRAGQRMYPKEEVRILASPLFLPLFWVCSTVELGYPIVRAYGMLSKRWPGQTGQGLAMSAGGILAMVVTLCQEALAVRAKWWTYKPAYAVTEGGLAWHVIIANFFIFLSFLPLFGRYLASPGTRLFASIRYGAVFAGAIFASYVAAYLLVMRPSL